MFCRRDYGTDTMRLKDWKVKAETARYVSKLYNGREHPLPSNIVKDIDSLDYEKLTASSRTEDNKILSSQLTSLGWKKGFRVGTWKDIRVDFVKGKVGLEVQFRQDTNLLYNLLSLQVAYQRKRIGYGVIVTYDARTVSIVGENSMNASFQELDRTISEFEGAINFTIPLWSVGIR